MCIERVLPEDPVSCEVEHGDGEEGGVREAGAVLDEVAGLEEEGEERGGKGVSGEHRYIYCFVSGVHREEDDDDDDDVHRKGESGVPGGSR